MIDLTTGIWEAGAVLRYQNVVMEDTLEKEKKNIKLTFSGLRHVIKILKNMFDQDMKIFLVHSLYLT